jgi:hypothetical protein
VRRTGQHPTDPASAARALFPALAVLWQEESPETGARACGADGDAMLPDGYFTTAHGGLVVLWRRRPDGPAQCVAVTSQGGQAVAEIALRDARARARQERQPSCTPPPASDSEKTQRPAAMRPGDTAQPDRPPAAGRPAPLAELPPRLQEIAALRLAGWTLARIGARYGLTRERARQLLARAQARAGSPILPPCPGCGRPRHPKRRLCGECAERERAARRLRTCRLCGAAFAPAEREYAYCPACRLETRPCAQCGRPITRDRGRQSGLFRGRTWFCSRACLGRHLGRHYGSTNLRAWASRRRITAPRVVTRSAGTVLTLPGSCATALSERSVHLVPDPDHHRLVIRSGPGPDGALAARVSQTHLPPDAPLAPTREVFIWVGRAARLLPWLRPGTPLRASLRDAEIIVEPDAQP